MSHQLPIWMVARTVQGKPLATDPRHRRCSLSSITTLAWDPAAGAGGTAPSPRSTIRNLRQHCWQSPSIWEQCEARRLTAALAFVAVAAALALAGCTSNDSLADSYNKNDDRQLRLGRRHHEDDRRGRPRRCGDVRRARPTPATRSRAPTTPARSWCSTSGTRSCPPCRAEAADLEKLNQKYSAQGVVFVGVNKDDSAATARSFATSHGVTYPSILDAESGAVRLAFTKAHAISPNAVPTTLIIDAKGRVAARFSGLITSPSLVGDDHRRHPGREVMSAADAAP